MPDEMRWPKFRKGDYSWTTAKVLECYSWVSSESVVMRGAAEHLLRLVWPEATRKELLLVWECVMIIDEIRARATSGKPEGMVPQEGTFIDTRTNTMYFADED